MRKWRKENPEANKRRRAREDPNLKCARTQRWREAHPQEARAAAKAYRIARRETEAVRVRRWVVNNPEKASKSAHRRALSELEGNATRGLIEAKWKAGSRKCILCGKPIDPDLPARHPMSRTIEHLIPIARGGRHDLDNIDFAHHACNASKQDKTVEEYRDWLKRFS